MKYLGITVFILVACMPALGAGVNEYEFVSALSVPEASFQAVETKSVDHPTKFGANTVFNVGAPLTEGNISGDINVKGKPIRVDTLHMNNSTRVANSANTKWLVDTLNIRTGGTVRVGTLLAEQIDLQNTAKSMGTTLQVANKLQTDTNTWAKDGEIKGTGTDATLVADWKDGTDNKQFHFVPGTATGAATWKGLTRTPYEGTKNHPVDTRFYPIYTN